MIRALLLAVWVVFYAMLAEAKNINEDDVVCEREMVARYTVTTDDARLFALCTTYANGEIVRPLREKDVTNKLTAQQLNGLKAILGQLENYVESNESIPTPTPKPTSTP